MPLRVDTTIPFGNACDVLIDESGTVPQVEFAADAHGGPERLWFCFRILREGAGGAGGKVRLVLKHPETMLGGMPVENLCPVVRTPQADWQRLPGGKREVLPDGRSRGVWAVDAPDPWTDIAFCYPYGPDDVRALADSAGGKYWRTDTIGVSQAARPIVRLSNGPGEPKSPRPGLYLLSRQHSGETSGSWVLDGLLRAMPEAEPHTPLVWAVPLTNIDGVVQGDYGKDNFPYDLNRAWMQPPMRHEVMVLQRDIRLWKDRCRPAVGMDFHSPGGAETGGAYFYVPDPEKEKAAHEAAMKWVKPLAEAVGPELMAADYARVARYASRWETPGFRHWCQTQGVPGLCLETPYSRAGAKVLTREVYRELGARLAAAFVRLTVA